MEAVVYSSRALEHLERAFDSLQREKSAAAPAAADAVRSAVENLASHPLIGRRVEGDVRELIISYGQTGYIALYRFVIPTGEVRILALRHHREIGFVP